MIKVIIKDIILAEYFPSPLSCFLLRNFNCNDDCLACLGYPTVCLISLQGSDETRMNKFNCLIFLNMRNNIWWQFLMKHVLDSPVLALSS